MGEVVFKAFKTYADAILFAHSQRRGYVVWEEYTMKRHQATHRCREYLTLVHEHGVDRYAQPYCVVWHNN